MRLAFAVLYHKNPKQLNYLLSQLDDINHDIYLHIDAKYEYNQDDFYKFKKARLFIQPDNKRFDIKWGGFSMVRTTIELYRTIIQSNIQYDYITLMSAQDLFIKPMKQYHDFLEQHNGLEFIAYWRLTSEMYYHWGLDFDSELVDGNEKPSKKAALMIKYSLATTVGVANIQKRSNKKYNLLKTKKGSQWTTLTLDCIKYIVEFSDTNSEFFETFQESMCPDELYIQTIIWFSKYRSKIFNVTHGRLDSVSNLRRVNWNPRLTNPSDMPHTYTYKKYYQNFLTNTEAFIARKFNYTVDEKIIKYVFDNLFYGSDSLSEELDKYKKIDLRNPKKVSSKKFLEKLDAEYIDINGGVNSLIDMDLYLKNKAKKIKINENLALQNIKIQNKSKNKVKKLKTKSKHSR
jgi:hypothetical protein